jgi:pentatricopeptide repeat protein
VTCSKISDAQRLFDQSSKKKLAMITAMMKGLIHSSRVTRWSPSFIGFISNKQPKKAIDLFLQVHRADEVTMIVFFSTCAEVGDEQTLRLVKKSLSTMLKSFLNNKRLLSSLFDALLRCGDCSGAGEIFVRMDKTVSNYGYFMSELLKQDQPEQVLQLYQQMKGDRIEPNYITCLAAIKALGRIGTEDLAQLFIDRIPKSILPHEFISNALIDMWVCLVLLSLSLSLHSIIHVDPRARMKMFRRPKPFSRRCRSWIESATQR